MDTQSDDKPKVAEPPRKAEGRLARHRRIAADVYRQPRSIVGHLRRGLVALWVSRGAGFYGLGWIFTFVILEVNMFADEFSGSEGIAEFIGSQLVEYLLRIGLMSFVNSLQAFLWPLFVVERMELWGIALLVGGYLGFEYGVRPLVERLVPELKVHREAVAAAKAAKTQKKQARARKKQARIEKKARNRAQRDHSQGVASDKLSQHDAQEKK